MTRHRGKRTGRGMQNLRSAGWDTARFTARAADKVVTGLARWVTTDHSGMTKALAQMPEMGFIDTLRYMLSCFCVTLVYAVVGGLCVFFTFAYWIPFLLGLVFR